MQVSERIGKRIEAITAFIAAVKEPHKIINLLHIHIAREEGRFIIQRFYALGYIDPMRGIEHWYVFPLHYVVRAIRAIDHRWNHYRHQLSSIDVAIIQAYHKGIEIGNERSNYRMAKTAIDKAIDVIMDTKPLKRLSDSTPEESIEAPPSQEIADGFDL